VTQNHLERNKKYLMKKIIKCDFHKAEEWKLDKRNKLLE